MHKPADPVRPTASTPTELVAGEFVIRSPHDGSEVGRVRATTRGDVDEAVRAARHALATDPLETWRRVEILEAAAGEIGRRAEEFAERISREAAKPITAARTEVQRGIATFAAAATAARTITGEAVPVDAVPQGSGRLAFTVRVPIGVVGAITPFNFPLNLVAHKIAPALAAGCPVVLKPAEQTPLTALALRDVLVESCGLPPAYLSVLPGTGAEVGARLAEHPGVDYVSFTGSVPAGRAIQRAAWSKKVALELGNNSPVIVTADADWERAARDVVAGAFGYSGQTCVSVQRVLVHSSIAGEFADLVAQETAKLAVGSPDDAATVVSALVSASAADRVERWVDEAAAAGARVLTERRRVGTTVWPVVLSEVPADQPVWADEVFGPVVALREYTTVDEAIAEANDTRFGLQASIYTQDLPTALNALRRLDFGGVLVNEVPSWRVDLMPYGGVRDSGNTKEGPAYAARDMTEERLLVVRP
jgi:acyl-CoA reductase-like NAD-dependent aldehyde dehydrogenase